jgi:arylsulfatase A-like enzyme
MRRAVALALVAAVVGIAVVAFLLRSRAEKPRNVILISIDTLRQDRLGSYGYGRATTPHLDALAARGVVFENATAPSSWTVPSHVSLLTGLYPQTHGATGRVQSMNRTVVPLASWLGSFGYDTGGIVNFVLLSRSRGFARGFDHFEVVERPLPEPAAPLVDEQALAWLDRPRDQPFFLFVHHYDVHSDYAPVEPYRKMFVRPYDGIATGATEQLKAARLGRLDLGPADAQHLSDLYDAEIRQIDDELGRFFQELERRGHLEGTVVILTADHGEEFLEHGRFLHGWSLYKELVQVPLLISGPGIPSGVRVAEPASLVDVFPTVTGLLGLAAPPVLEGIDLSRSWRERAPLPTGRPVFFETDWWLGRAEGQWKRAVQRGPWKLHYAHPQEAWELYDLARDPGEHHDLAAREPERSAELRELLATRLGDGSPAAHRVEPSADEMEQLRALGYVE